MVTKHEVKEHYAMQRTDSNQGMCPQVIERILDAGNYPEDGIGIYTLSGELLGVREYYTLDGITGALRAAIKQQIADLEKILED